MSNPTTLTPGPSPRGRGEKAPPLLILYVNLYSQKKEPTPIPKYNVCRTSPLPLGEGPGVRGGAHPNQVKETTPQ